MDYKIPDDIKAIAENPNFSKNEQELLKNEIVHYLRNYYLDLKMEKNSLANVTDLVKDFFKVKGTNYPFERDIAGRMMRTRNYTMQEGLNEAGKKEVYVIAADRDWWDKNKIWFSIIVALIGTLLGAISEPIMIWVSNLLRCK